LLSAIGQQAGLAIQNATLYRSAIQSERLAAIGETTAALSHSVKNILQALRGGADVVEMGLKAQNIAQAAKGWSIVSRNLDKIYNLTLNLLAYSKDRRPAVAPTSINTLVDECLELLAPAASEKGCTILSSVSDNLCPVPMDSDAMHQVLMNLLSNALDAVTPGSGQIVITADIDTSHPSPEAHHAVISVSDNGSGIAPNLMKHVFELFHSTKGNRGTGLGLAVSKKLVDEHDGTLTVASTLGQGSSFTVRLPMYPNLPTDGQPPRQPQPPAQVSAADPAPQIKLRPI
jgi:signal transduction histidine kinase